MVDRIMSLDELLETFKHRNDNQPTVAEVVKYLAKFGIVPREMLPQIFARDSEGTNGPRPLDRNIVDRLPVLVSMYTEDGAVHVGFVNPDDTREVEGFLSMTMLGLYNNESAVGAFVNLAKISGANIFNMAMRPS